MPEIRHLLLGMAGHGCEFYNSQIGEVIAYYGTVKVLEAEMFLVNNCRRALMLVLED